jgi:hypothetical protein
MATEKETIAKAPKTRVSRTPVGQRNVLTVLGKDPEYEYRIVNDTGDRIAAFQDAGYTIVEADAVRVGDKRVGRATSEGTSAQVSVGTTAQGQGQKAFVMKIPKAFYNEDQAVKLQKIKQLEETIKQPSGDYGKITIGQ